MPLVLIVDDDPGIRNMLDELLRDEGYSTALAANGQAALVTARDKCPSLILMDLMMPVLDGASAVRILKSDPDTSWMRIIAMSAGVNLRNQADLLPADGVMSKPFDLDALLADVQIQLRQVDSHNSCSSSGP